MSSLFFIHVHHVLFPNMLKMVETSRVSSNLLRDVESSCCLLESETRCNATRPGTPLNSVELHGIRNTRPSTWTLPNTQAKRNIPNPNTDSQGRASKHAPCIHMYPIYIFTIRISQTWVSFIRDSNDFTCESSSSKRPGAVLCGSCTVKGRRVDLTLITLSALVGCGSVVLRCSGWRTWRWKSPTSNFIGGMLHKALHQAVTVTGEVATLKPCHISKCSNSRGTCIRIIRSRSNMIKHPNCDKMWQTFKIIAASIWIPVIRTAMRIHAVQLKHQNHLGAISGL